MNTKHNMIYRLMICTIAGIILLIGIFYFSQTIQVRNQSIDTLTSFTETSLVEDRVSSPGVDYFSEEDINDGMETEVEKLIWEYYEEKGTTLTEGEVYEISKGTLKAYFLVKTDGSVDRYTYNNEEEVSIIYADVSFTMSIIRNSILVMSFVLLIFIVILYVANRYLVKKLEEKDMVMRSFFENASHELKTPLMSIGGYVEGLKTGVTDEAASYEVIDKEINRMSKLISEILDISKVDGGLIRLQKSENDVREILYDCLTSIEPIANKKGIELVVEMDRPMIRTCDENMVESVFANILSNAVRYANSNISVISDDHKILISNDGELPAEEEMVHIFDRFYKGRKGETGIGMALAKEYARLNDMELNVEIKEERLQFIILY